MKTIAITGASGFVGTNLNTFFRQKSYKVIAISREDLDNRPKLEEIMQESDIVINLAGANIINRWSEKYKKTLFKSRIETTTKVVAALNSVENKPELFISTSAVGIYDNKKNHTEDDYNYPKDDFLSNLCQQWEKRANQAHTRVVIYRFGIVLGKNGGALSKMLTPFKLGLGGTIGNGSQSLSFIHMEDLQEAFLFAIKNNESKGVYNLTAPLPTTNKGLTEALGKSLNKPTFLPVPPFALKLMFGDGSRVLTDGQSATPKRLIEAGFNFKFKTIEDTIEDLCGTK